MHQATPNPNLSMIIQYERVNRSQALYYSIPIPLYVTQSVSTSSYEITVHNGESNLALTVENTTSTTQLKL